MERRNHKGGGELYNLHKTFDIVPFSRCLTDPRDKKLLLLAYLGRLDLKFTHNSLPCDSKRTNEAMD